MYTLIHYIFWGRHEQARVNMPLMAVLTAKTELPTHIERKAVSQRAQQREPDGVHWNGSFYSGVSLK